jgi:hypothetical protein
MISRAAKHPVQTKQTSHAASAGKKSAAAKKKPTTKAPAKQAKSTFSAGHAQKKPAATHAASAAAVHVPAGWHKYSPEEGAKAMKDVIENGDGLSLELGHGQSVGLDSSDYTSLVKSGALTLYKNPKEDRGDPDDDTGKLGPWMPGYHLTLNRSGALATVATQLESLLKSSAEISKSLDGGLEKFHNTVHAARVNNVTVGSPELAKIKEEVRAALPQGQAVVAAFDEANTKWQAKAKAIESSLLGSDEKKFLTDALTTNAPKSQGGLGIDPQLVKDIITSDHAILSRPEVFSVDPGFDGLRVIVDTPTVVKNDSSMQGYANDLAKLLKDKGVKTPVEVERNISDTTVAELAAKSVLVPVIGVEGLAQYGEGNNEISIGVHQANFEAAKKLEPQLQAFADKYAAPGRHPKVVVEAVTY